MDSELCCKKIKLMQPIEEKLFVLGLPTGSSPLGMYRAALTQETIIIANSRFFENVKAT
jgi:glucosamine-6-phosphate deaminase